VISAAAPCCNGGRFGGGAVSARCRRQQPCRALTSIFRVKELIDPKWRVAEALMASVRSKPQALGTSPSTSFRRGTIFVHDPKTGSRNSRKAAKFKA
jgi:hypothetical protein